MSTEKTNTEQKYKAPSMRDLISSRFLIPEAYVPTPLHDEERAQVEQTLRSANEYLDRSLYGISGIGELIAKAHSGLKASHDEMDPAVMTDVGWLLQQIADTCIALNTVASDARHRLRMADQAEHIGRSVKPH